MAKRSRGQKIGAQGHAWVLSEIENHRHWIARALPQDFGIDAEAELNVDSVKGEILKLQFKTSQQVIHRDGRVRIDILRKYLNYAISCRYPVVMIRIDISAKQAWYLWLQQWILAERAKGNDLSSSQNSFTTWIDETRTLQNGLETELQEIAAWRGETQLVLSLLDAMRAAASNYNPKVVSQLLLLLSEAAPAFSKASFDMILSKAIQLGDKLRGTAEGLTVANQLFEFVRRFGNHMGIAAIDLMVRRDDSCSRTGITGLAILYDEFFDHAVSLRLVDHFLECGLPEVAYYCALRQANPGKSDLHFFGGAGDFVFAGLKFYCPDNIFFGNKYANRGPSAILDCLIATGDS
jgi:hypothetical protein